MQWEILLGIAYKLSNKKTNNYATQMAYSNWATYTKN